MLKPKTKRSYHRVPIIDKTQLTLALLSNGCFVLRPILGCTLNHPESYPCIIADGTFKIPHVWKPVAKDYVESYND